MKKTHDYVHHYSGYRSDGGRCRIRIYREDGQAPVVICSQLPDNDNTSVTNMAEYLAAEAVATPTVGVWEKRGGGVDGLRTRLAADSRYRPAIAERRHRMIGKLLSKEETSAALVLALSGALMVLVAKGDRPLPLGRIVSRILSNPIPVRGVTSTRGNASVPAPDQQIAA